MLVENLVGFVRAMLVRLNSATPFKNRVDVNTLDGTKTIPLIRIAAIFASLTLTMAAGQNASGLEASGTRDSADDRTGYILGPLDQISIWALGVDELADKPVHLDSEGYIDLPLAGRIRAEGLTVDELKVELEKRLKPYVREPHLTVSIVESRSQPVSVLGAVTNPGVHQLNGHKTLVEAISLAGGFRPDAGYIIKITRDLRWGRIPLPTAKDDETGRFSVAEVELKSVLNALRPEENIVIKPNDVVSVPRAEVVYVIGEVIKAGGFVLNERETLSVLQALSLAGGLTRTAASSHAKILRGKEGAHRQEMEIDLKRILSGKSQDIPLTAEDILFIPNSTAKSATNRAIDAAINIGSGILIWRR